MTRPFVLPGLFLAAALAAGPALAQAAAEQPAAPAAETPAAPAPAPATPAEPAAAPAAPPAAASGRIQPPPAGKGQVVFFRPSRFVGMALSYSVREGDIGVGKLGNNSYFVLTADPGPHAYSISGEVTDTLNMEIEDGETQYAQQTIGIGVVTARPRLSPSDQVTFDGMPGLKVSTKVATDRKPRAAN